MPRCLNCIVVQVDYSLCKALFILAFIAFPHFRVVVYWTIIALLVITLMTLIKGVVQEATTPA